MFASSVRAALLPRTRNSKLFKWSRLTSTLARRPKNPAGRAKFRWGFYYHPLGYIVRTYVHTSGYIVMRHFHFYWAKICRVQYLDRVHSGFYSGRNKSGVRWISVYGGSLLVNRTVKSRVIWWCLGKCHRSKKFIWISCPRRGYYRV